MSRFFYPSPFCDQIILEDNTHLLIVPYQSLFYQHPNASLSLAHPSLGLGKVVFMFKKTKPISTIQHPAYSKNFFYHSFFLYADVILLRALLIENLIFILRLEFQEKYSLNTYMLQILNNFKLFS